MVRCANAGADGHIVNAEIEFTNKRDEAARLGTAIRNALPDWHIGHAPLGWVSYHPTWPYEEFAAWCDSVHPQMYWTELKHGQYSAEFRAQIALWRDGHRHGGKGPQPWRSGGGHLIAPIGCTYGRGDVQTVQQPPGKFDATHLATFLEDDALTAPAVSLYSLEVAHPTCVEYLQTTWSWTPPDTSV